jgi:pyrroloquinoline quinone biosynthesis protein B
LISVIVLGAGAGGGFPQWNSNAAACRRARAGDPAALSCTQTSVAVSADREHWVLLNAAPDLRVQIERTEELHPRTGLRSSPIAGVALAGAEIDAVTGLLTLREGHAFGIYATASVHAHLDQNPMFEALSRSLVRRITLRMDASQPMSLPDGRASGLTLRVIAVPGKVPLYMEATAPVLAVDDETVGLELCDGVSRLLFVPGCAAMTDALRARIAAADCVMFDATLWTDDEMVHAGSSAKTGRAMGHMSISGPAGVLAELARVPISRRILIHINNSNPVLLSDSPERQAVVDAGWQVAFDGMRFVV